jgi:hypothetical protein
VSPDERFERVEKIGEGGFGRTYLATDRTTGEPVVVKQLRVRGLPNWKPVEAFEREVKVLRSLSHPGIPAFVAAFEQAPAVDGNEEDRDVEMTIVVEFVPGETLGARIGRGDRWSEAQAHALLRDLLETLRYLHELAPPVIHRDITPANIVVRPDGRAILVDFGAVRDLATPRAGQMTVLGTPGYMAPEQSLGVSDPRSDLYSLGATVLHTLTHIAPVALPRQDLRFDFDRIEGLPPTLVGVLSRMTDPDPGRRWPSARSVLDALGRGGTEPADEPGTALAMAAPSSALVLADEERELTPAVLRRLDYRNALAIAAMQPSDSGAPKRIIVGSAVAAAGLIAAGVVIGPAVAAAMPLAVAGGLGYFFLNSFRRRDRSRRLFAEGEQTEGKLVSSRQGQQGVFLDYVYKVNGERYAGIGYTSDVTVTNSIRVGMPVLVFYDPDVPRHSVGLLRSELDGIRVANF